jgi:hypothetical protein
MQWFKSIEGVDDCQSAEHFFELLGVEYHIDQLRARRLHVMRAFNRALSEVTPQAGDERALAAELLAQVYREQVNGELSDVSPLQVYKRLRPSAVSLDDLLGGG